MARGKARTTRRKVKKRPKKAINWSGRAKRWWKWAWWVDGNGPFALLAHCRVLTVRLYAKCDEAERDKAVIDRGGCGGPCYGNHEIVDLRKKRPNREPEAELEEFRDYRRRWMGV